MTTDTWPVTPGRQIIRPFRTRRAAIADHQSTAGTIRVSHHSLHLPDTLPSTAVKMSDQVQELLNVPREFLREGMQFVNRSQKRE